MKKILFAFVFLVMVSGKLYAAESPNFIFPLACSIGKDCWTVNYVDVDPGEEAKDFKCSVKTYQDHKGTDFGVRSLADVDRGVSVLAAKSGKVARIRDGETDTIKAEADLQAIKDAKKECGNAVFINHGSGLYTLYCHLKQNSVTVKIDEEVTAGQKIGEVGHSGLAEFPHLHFGVVWEGGVIDPYTGLLNNEYCGRFKQNLWAPGQGLEYESLALYDAGFRGKVPDFDAIKHGEFGPEILNADSNALVFWAAFYGVKEGDEILLKITDPKGRTFVERPVIQDKNRARQYYYTGRKRPDDLASGDYTGTATIKRGNDEQTLSKTIRVR